MIFRVLNQYTRKNPGLLFSKTVRNFCVNEAYLKPIYHITMTHNISNVYEDVISQGDYLITKNDMSKVPSQKYMPNILQITFSHLNKKYPKASLKLEDYEKIRIEGWDRYGINFDEEKLEILETLAKQIFVSEHKYRWPIEQRTRLENTTKVFTFFHFNNYRMEFFFDVYNYWINLDVQRSHLFKSPKIKGDLSYLEKYAEDNSTEPTGIEALNREIPENQTFINRVMKVIHS